MAEALRWSGDAEVEPVALAAAGIGMAAPVLAAGAAGHLQLGLAACIGSLAVAGRPSRSSVGAQVRDLASALAPAVAAAVAAALIAHRGWLTDVALAVLAGAAARAGGLGRSATLAAMRFVPFLAVTVAAADGSARPGALVVLVFAGALWSSLVALLLGTLARTWPTTATAGRPASPAAPPARAARGRRRAPSRLARWEHALRLGACLAVAGAVRSAWPDHHLGWIAVTVAILTERRVEPVPVRTTQRAVGTALGVAVAGAFLSRGPSLGALALGIGALAALRPLLWRRNYLAYSAMMTPLVLLMLDAGRPLEPGILLDRLIATLAGGALVIAANLVAIRALASRTRVEPLAS